MADRYVFSDEAGNFDFSRQSGASRYFILGTVTAGDCRIGDRLLQLRRELGWRGTHLDKVFHATDDPQAVRDEVFETLARGDIRIDATILEKSKAQPHLHQESALYKMAWFLHFKHVAPRIANSDDRLFVVASRLGTKKKRGSFHTAVDDVVAQVSPCASHRVAFWPAESDPCLQVPTVVSWLDPLLLGVSAFRTQKAPGQLAKGRAQGLFRRPRAKYEPKHREKRGRAREARGLRPAAAGPRWRGGCGCRLPRECRR